MYRSEINEYKFEIERVNFEMQTVKKKYFDQRRKLRTHKIQSRGSQVSHSHGQAHNLSQPPLSAI
jgi:hypothetical protein